MNKNKIISLFLAALVATSVLSGCKIKNSTSESDGFNSKVQITSLPEKFNPEVTITTVGMTSAGVKYHSGESLTDNVHTRWAKEKLGINLKYLWTVNDSGQGEFNTRLRLALASKQDLPDFLFLYNSSMLQELIDSGLFMDVGPLIDQYGTTDLKESLAFNTNTTLQYTRKDKLFAIPVQCDPNAHDSVLWIRQDWLDRLHLSAPKTISDLEIIMDAFVNKDPDNNGKKDTYGIGVSWKDGIGAGCGNFSWIFGAYGPLPGMWYKDENSLKYGSVSKTAKTALIKMAEWYKKGYLHKEFAMQGTFDMAQMVAGERVGIIAGAAWMAFYPFPDLYSMNPNAVMKPYPIPTGDDNKAARYNSSPTFGGILVNKNMQHPEAIIRYMNEFYGNIAYGNGEYAYGLHEGYDWATVEGKPTRDSSKIPGGLSEVQKWTFTGTWMHNTMAEYSRLERFKTNKLTEKDTVAMEGPLNKLFFDARIARESQQISVSDLFQGAPTKSMTSKAASLGTVESETYTKIITGQLDPSSFDKFVTDWESNGGSEMTADVNNWYQTQNKVSPLVENWKQILKNDTKWTDIYSKYSK